jgi:hypothetical protein
MNPCRKPWTPGNPTSQRTWPAAVLVLMSWLSLGEPGRRTDWRSGHTRSIVLL